MPDIVNGELQAGKFVASDPATGAVSIIAVGGALASLLAHDPVAGDTLHGAPAGSAIGGGTRRHLFDREVYVDNTGAGGYVNVRDWGSLLNKPATFPPSAHSHTYVALKAADGAWPTTVAGYGITDAITTAGGQIIAGGLQVNGGVTGNASTASQLATARTINGVAFNGSANITVPAAAGTLTGTALPGTVVTSSLTSVGALSAGSIAAGFGAAVFGGSVTFSTDGAFDMGNSVGARARHLNITGSITLGGEVGFGGFTSTTVTLVRSGTTLNLELGDHSDWADFKARALTLTSDLNLPGGGLGISNGTTRFLAVAAGANPVVALNGTLAATGSGTLHSFGGTATASIGAGYTTVSITGASGGGIAFGVAGTAASQGIVYSDATAVGMSALGTQPIAFICNGSSVAKFTSAGLFAWTDGVVDLGSTSANRFRHASFTGDLTANSFNGGGASGNKPFVATTANGNLQYVMRNASGVEKFAFYLSNGGNDWTLYNSALGLGALFVSGAANTMFVNGTFGINTTPGANRWFHLAASTSGDFIAQINNTAAVGPEGLVINYGASTPNDTGHDFLYCTDSTVARLRLLSNGGLANFSANNVNLSDERTKTFDDGVVDAADWYDRFQRIEIVRFKYRDQTHDDWNIGYSAQQVGRIAPELVDGINWSRDGESLLAVYSTDLANVHIAVTQESQRRIAALESRVLELERRRA